MLTINGRRFARTDAPITHPLPRHPMSNSWVVTRRDTGTVVGEFYDARIVERFNPEKALVETAHAYLCRINAALKAKQATS